MTIASTAQIQYTQPINKTTAVKAVSAYGDVAPTQQADRMAQMEEKYKDVFTPMPPRYSEEIEKARDDKIREKYPNYLSFDELMGKLCVRIEQNATKQEYAAAKAVGEQNHKKYVESLGGQEVYEASMKYSVEVGHEYPVNFWDRKNIKVSNSKELATFYNAAVYEGLEKGKSVEEASTVAFHAVDSYMDTSEYYNKTIGEYFGASLANPQLTKQEINYNLNIDLREFGFDMDSGTKKIYQNEKDMQNFAQLKLDYYNFIIENQGIVDMKYSQLNSSYIGGRKSYDDVVKPVIDWYLPQAQVAAEVFSKYKVYDSINIQA